MSQQHCTGIGAGELLRRIRCAPASSTSQPGLMTSAAWGFHGGHLQHGMGIFWGPTFKFLHLRPHFSSHKSFHQGRMQRLISPPPCQAVSSSAQVSCHDSRAHDMVKAGMSLPILWMLQPPQARCHGAGDCGCVLQAGARHGANPLLCQHVPLRPQLLGALPRQAQGTAAARRHGGRRSLLCQDVCSVRGPHCHKSFAKPSCWP